jgi:hypothetical protein
MTAFIAILLGVMGALLGIFLERRARKQFGWDAAPGTICSSRVQGGEFYEPEIEYTYSYRGRPFRATNVRSFGMWPNWRGPAQRVVDRYPPGLQVTVFVNPENPWDSVLERGADPYFLPFVLSISGLLLIFGLSRIIFS